MLAKAPRFFKRTPTDKYLIKSALVAVFSGLALGTNYLLIGLPNIKFMDTVYFVAAYLFGLSVGLPVVLLTRTIYATVNPLGPASGWLMGVLIAGDCLYALAGSAAGRARLVEKRTGVVEQSMLLGLIGLLTALGFDLITNFATGLVAVTAPDFSTYLGRAFLWGLVTMNFPLPMGILHEFSDFLFFSTVAPAALALLRRSPLIEQGPIAKVLRSPGR